MKHLAVLPDLPVLPVLPDLPEVLEGRFSKAGSRRQLLKKDRNPRTCSGVSIILQHYQFTDPGLSLTRQARRAVITHFVRTEGLPGPVALWTWRRKHIIKEKHLC